MSKMKDEIPEHSATWRTRWETMTDALDNGRRGPAQVGPQPQRQALAAARSGLGVAFLLIVLADIAVNEEWFVPSADGRGHPDRSWPSGPETACGGSSPAYGERAAKWRAFERWTKDFPSLKDDPPATLELWKRILVFGVAFGTAKRMIESGRIPAPVLESAGSTWTGTYFTGGIMTPPSTAHRSAPASPRRSLPSPPAAEAAASPEGAAAEVAAEAVAAAPGSRPDP